MSSYYRSNQNRVKKNFSVYRCKVCSAYHAIRFCPRFLRMNSMDRNRVVRRHDYCINCPAQSHTFKRCRSKNTCQRCNHYHHTLLHPSSHPRIMPPSRLGQQSSPSQLGQRSSPSRHSQKSIPKRSLPKPRKKKTPQPPVPDQRIISEAIKSLATVLCASTPTRRHV